MGFYARAKEVLVGSNNNRHAVTWNVDCANARVSDCPIYLHALLGLSILGGSSRA